MGNAKHTPGPWWISEHKDDDGNFVVLAGDIREEDPDLVVTVDSYDGEIERATARLIAAAPDMYDALCSIEEYWNGIPESAVDAIEEVIRKAGKVLDEIGERKAKKDERDKMLDEMVNGEMIKKFLTMNETSSKESWNDDFGEMIIDVFERAVRRGESGKTVGQLMVELEEKFNHYEGQGNYL